jgi:hypothetical protein
MSLLEIALVTRVYSCEEEDVGDDHHIHHCVHHYYSLLCRDVTRREHTSHLLSLISSFVLGLSLSLSLGVTRVS